MFGWLKPVILFEPLGFALLLVPFFVWLDTLGGFGDFGGGRVFVNRTLGSGGAH